MLRNVRFAIALTVLVGCSVHATAPDAPQIVVQRRPAEDPQAACFTMTPEDARVRCPGVPGPCPCDGDYDCPRCHYDPGREAYERGDFAIALACFIEEYQLRGRPTMIANMGAAHERMDRPERALACYRFALSSNNDTAYTAELESRIARLTDRSRDE